MEFLLQPTLKLRGQRGMKCVGEKNEPDFMTSEVVLPQEYSTHKLYISQWKQTD